MAAAIDDPGSMIPSRVSIYSIPTLLLYALPLLVAAGRLGVGAAAALLLAIFSLRTWLGLAAFKCSRVPVLDSISASHYVELVRWSLDRLGVEYREVESIGVLGAIFFGRQVPALHVPGVKTTVADSPNILRYLYATHVHEERAVFLAPVGRPEDRELEALLLSAAAHFRRWTYWHIFNDGRAGRQVILRAWGVRQPHVPAWQKAAMRVAYPLAKGFIRTMLKVDDKGKAEALAQMHETFDAVDARLADGRKYLLGTAGGLTYVDMIFAVSAALFLRPKEFSGGRVVPASMIEREDFSALAQEESRPFLERPAGQFCLRLFREERGLAGATARGKRA